MTEKAQGKVPQLRFPEFSGEWIKVRLGSCCEFTQGVQIPQEEQTDTFREGYIRYLYIRDFFSERFACYVKDIYPHKIINSNEIMMVNTGNTAGKAFSGASGVLSNNAFKISFDEQEIDSHFLLTFLQSDSTQRKIRSFFNAAGQPHLGHKNIAALVFPKPENKEQNAIASFIYIVDKKISLLKQKHEQLVLYKKGIMQQLFSQQLRFKDDNGQDFPDWEVKKGNKIFDVISDKKHNSDLPILAITQEHGAIPRDLINYQVQVTDNSVSGYKVVNKGDYIISLRSFQGGIEYSNYKGICSPAYIILRPSIAINDDFYRYYLKTNNFIQEMKKRLEGIRDGKILSYKYFSEINLPSPSVEEQNKIADFLDAIDKKINLAQQQIEQTQAYKQGLLQQMFV